MELYEGTTLWKNAFDNKVDGLNDPRELLKNAYRDFRIRVALLLQQIQKELPSLTIHDITHVDSLWRIASEIAGPDYDLNPAEAFILGGAFLLHDAAHSRAAFPGGLKDLQETVEWRDAAAQRGLTPDALIEGSNLFQTVLFDTLRALHPKQAKKLAFAQWPAGDGSSHHLLPHDELREAYGHLIGEIAESHWWYPHELEPFSRLRPTAPVCLAPASWTVDMLKVAILLRTADAAHIDAKRAPRLLMLMNQPQGLSQEHWQFQARLHQPTCIRERSELVFSGSPFPQEELSAWWLAFDAACLANKELLSADLLLRDNLPTHRLAARSVAGSHSPGSFSVFVPTDDWQPVDTSIKISDIKSIVERFGGEKLYGKDPSAALRELLQNAVDAVHACRSLGGLGETEGEIEIALEDHPEGHWLHVIDTGIGMSRYTLTEVLLDFGRSLWRSAELRGEWSGLAAAGFEAIGQFGIGFFSVFMLGNRVQVVTRRYEPKVGEALQWLLEFPEGTNKRPILRAPAGNEKLKRHGTRVSVLISREKLVALCKKKLNWQHDSTRDISLAQVCARLAPALDIDLYVSDGNQSRQHAVTSNDWLTLPALDLLRRIIPGHLDDISPTNFGFWSHLSELRNESGHIIGRCAAQPLNFLGPNPGIGIVKGILAGPMHRIAGIVMSKPQSDLARKESIPDALLSDVQSWAESQKSLLVECGKLDADHSALLAIFGASYNGLMIGRLDGETVSYDEFINALREIDQILVHDGEVDFEEEDQVLRSEFEDNFMAHELLLESTSLTPPDWLDEITESIESRKSWSLRYALDLAMEEAWGQVASHYEDVEVGTVNGTKIIRECLVASRWVEDD